MKSLKQLKKEGFCLSIEEQKEIIGRSADLIELSYYRDTGGNTDCERCAAKTYPDGTHEKFNCLTTERKNCLR